MGTSFMSIITADFGSMLCCQTSRSSFSSVPPVVRIDTWLTSPPRTLILYTVIDELRKVASLYGDENDELSMAMAVYMPGFNTYMGFGDKIRGELGEDKDGMLKRIYEYVKRLK